MINFNEKGQQEVIAESGVENNLVERDPFSLDNNLEDIKAETAKIGRALLDQSLENVRNDFTSFSEIIANDGEAVTELGLIKTETESGILAQEKIFLAELEALNVDGTENSGVKLEGVSEKELNHEEETLRLISSAYKNIKALERDLKNLSNKDEIKKTNLRQLLSENTSLLENSEATYKSVLADRVRESFKNKPDMTPARALNEIIIPGLSAMEKEKAAALPGKDFSIFTRGLEIINSYLPKGKVAQTLTVAGIMTIASLAMSSAPSVGLAVYLGCKLGRSLIGSYVGEKVSDIVEKQIDKRADRKKEADIEKIDFTKEDINNAINQLVDLGGANLKSEKNQLLLKNFAKISTHIVAAGATVAGLEIAQLGVESLLSGAETASGAAGDASLKTLASKSFFACSVDAGQDLVEDKVVDFVTKNRR